MIPLMFRYYLPRYYLPTYLVSGLSPLSMVVWMDNGTICLWTPQALKREFQVRTRNQL